MESRTQFRVHAALIKLKADTNDQDEITSLWGKTILNQLFSDDQVTLWGEYERSKTQCGFYAVALPSVIIGDTKNLIYTFSSLSFAKLMFILVSK